MIIIIFVSFISQRKYPYLITLNRWKSVYFSYIFCEGNCICKMYFKVWYCFDWISIRSDIELSHHMSWNDQYFDRFNLTSTMIHSSFIMTQLQAEMTAIIANISLADDSYLLPSTTRSICVRQLTGCIVLSDIQKINLSQLKFPREFTSLSKNIFSNSTGVSRYTKRRRSDRISGFQTAAFN